MAKNAPPPDIARRHYAALSRGPLHSLVFIAPLLAFFHISSIWVGLDVAPLVVVHMSRAFERLGGTASFLPALPIVAVLLIQHFARRDRLAVHPSVLGCMLVESFAWMLPMIAILHVAGMLHIGAGLAAEAATPATLFGRIIVGVGAGVYEEFIFRLVLIGLIQLFLVNVLSLPKDVVAVAAVILTAAAFSLYHPNIWLQEGFAWGLFLFYAVTGAYLGAVFLRRGLGIVVGAHCLFNIYRAIVWST